MPAGLLGSKSCSGPAIEKWVRIQMIRTCVHEYETCTAVRMYACLQPLPKNYLGQELAAKQAAFFKGIGNRKTCLCRQNKMHGKAILRSARSWYGNMQLCTVSTAVTLFREMRKCRFRCRYRPNNSNGKQGGRQLAPIREAGLPKNEANSYMRKYRRQL